MTRKYYSSTLSRGPVKSLPSKAKLTLKVGYKNWFRTNCSGGYCSQTVNNICLQVLTRLGQNLFVVLISFFLGSKEKVCSSENTYIFSQRTLCLVLQVLSSLGSAPTLLNMFKTWPVLVSWHCLWGSFGIFLLFWCCPFLVSLKNTEHLCMLCSSFSICPFFLAVFQSWTPCGNPLITNNFNPKGFTQVCTVWFRLQLVVVMSPKFWMCGSVFCSLLSAAVIFGLEPKFPGIPFSVRPIEN